MIESDITWTSEQLESMGISDLFDKAMFLSGCEKHRIHLDWIDGYIVTEENMQKFAELIIEEYKSNPSVFTKKGC